MSPCLQSCIPIFQAPFLYRPFVTIHKNPESDLGISGFLRKKTPQQDLSSQISSIEISWFRAKFLYHWWQGVCHQHKKSGIYAYSH